MVNLTFVTFLLYFYSVSVVFFYGLIVFLVSIKVGITISKSITAWKKKEGTTLWYQTKTIQKTNTTKTDTKTKLQVNSTSHHFIICIKWKPSQKYIYIYIFVQKGNQLKPSSFQYISSWVAKILIGTGPFQGIFYFFL
jgi:hypothetical protein